MSRFRIEQEDTSKRAASKWKAIESCQRELKRQEIALYLLLDRLRQRQVHLDSRLATLDKARAFIADRLNELAAVSKQSEPLCNTRAKPISR